MDARRLSAVAARPVGMFSGMITRRWFLPSSVKTNLGTYRQTVALRHSTFSGFRYALVNGEEVHGTDGTSASLFLKPEGDTITMIVGDHRVEICIRPYGKMQFCYTAKIDNEFQRGVYSLQLGNEAYDIKVPETQIKGDVVWYRIDSTRKSDGKGTSCLRRYNQFFEIYQDIKSEFAGGPLKGSLPPFPQKAMKLFQDHKENSFIEARRRRLEVYMAQIAKLPGVATNPEFLRFIGFWDVPQPKIQVVSTHGLPAPIVKFTPKLRIPLREDEYSITFENKELGFTLKSENSQSTESPSFVAKFKLLKNGSIGPAERGGIISIGDWISRVANEDVMKMNHHDIVRKIRNSNRPLVLHFIRMKLPTLDLVADEVESNSTTPLGDNIFKIGELEAVGLNDMRLMVGEGDSDGLTYLNFTNDEITYFKKLFQDAGAIEGKLEGSNSVEFFQTFGVCTEDLQTIWRICCGGRSSSSIELKNFFIAMKLIAIKQDSYINCEITLENLIKHNDDVGLPQIQNDKNSLNNDSEELNASIGDASLDDFGNDDEWN